MMKSLRIPSNIILILLLLTSCKTLGPPSDAFVSSQSSVAKRERESRTFEVDDSRLLIQNVVATLQDFGFDIVESDAASGLVSGLRLQDENKFFGIRSEIRVTVTANLLKNKTAVVRANFQKIIPSHDPRLFKSKPILDDTLYQTFFSRLGQSLFLDRNDK